MSGKKRSKMMNELIAAKCDCCNKCKVYTKGPLTGKCLYGGPFLCYVDEKNKNYTLDDIETRQNQLVDTPNEPP